MKEQLPTYRFLALIVALEIFSLFTLIIRLNTDIMAILHFGAGLAIPLTCLFRTRSTNRPTYTLDAFWSSAFLLGLALFAVEYFKEIVQNHPLDFRIADMLPVIEIMNQRLLNMADPYAPISEIWSGIQPIYLPALWMAFLPAELVGMDLRWMSLVASFAATTLIAKTQSRFHFDIQLAILVLLVWCGMLLLDTRFFSMSQEAIVLFYYIFLAWALIQKNPVLIGIAVSLCLLSRYILAPWILLLAYLTWHKENRRFLVIGGITSISVVVILLSMGQAWGYIPLFIDLQQHYIESVMSDPSNYRPLIKDSIGMARFVPYEGLVNLHKTSLLLSVALPFIMIGLRRWLFTHLKWNHYVLIALKLSFVFYANLLVMPYIYLFVPSVFLSLMIYKVFIADQTVAAAR